MALSVPPLALRARCATPTRRQLLALLSGVGVLLGCRAVPAGIRSPNGMLESVGPNRPETPRLLVCMPETSQTLEVWAGLRDELARDYRLIPVAIESAADRERIATAVQRYQPRGLVLMNNPTVAAYRSYQLAAGGTVFPPAVIVMSSFLDAERQKLPSTTGISYEIPLITVVTNLRKLLATPIERVGVVLRSSLRQFVARQAALAAREKIVVIAEEVGPEPNRAELARALRRVKQHADAIWILNDNRLLTPQLIAGAWLPGLEERPWAPTIVGAASLVSSAHSFGTFAMLPDHTALGGQVAALLLDIADNGWAVRDDSDVQLPLSTTTTIDLLQAHDRFRLREDALLHVDHILE